jgi:uncharacterized protein
MPSLDQSIDGCSMSRRSFLVSSSLLVLAQKLNAAEPGTDSTEQIIDIHQHTNYSGRTDEQLIKHQEAMGVTTTVLLPAGSLYGLAASCGGNQSVVDLAKQHPGKFLYFANEVPDLPEARKEIERFLKQGAIGIGEQKFNVGCDSPHLEMVAAVAEEFHVPVLMHFQHNTYNLGIERFHKVLEKYPKVNFLGHAQTWWGNIDHNHDQTVLYPTGKVAPGGITDKLLSNYPNMFGDLSAGSGLNALLRDEDHTRAFLERHQDKLLFGSDCNDIIGRGPGCQGTQTLAALRRLAPNARALRKMFCENARKILKIESKAKRNP